MNKEPYVRRRRVRPTRRSAQKSVEKKEDKPK